MKSPAIEVTKIDRFTRDVWAHRMDIAVAPGHQMDLDAEHDGRIVADIVADIVAEWALTHGTESGVRWPRLALS